MSLAKIAMNFSRSLLAVSAVGKSGKFPTSARLPIVMNLSRNFRTSGKLNHDVGGIAYMNTPFKYKGLNRMTLYFLFYFGIGLWAPFWIVQYKILKGF